MTIYLDPQRCFMRGGARNDLPSVPRTARLRRKFQDKTISQE
ncbi:hypothetical protein [Paraburkholderia bannensis]|nr:hypothetical protein [Paraburkholderia bannensis]